MDRPVSTPVASPQGLDDASPLGWDAHDVWQRRVRDPQLISKRLPVTPRIRLEDRSAGWDPLETWRLRIQRPRNAPR